MGPIDQHFFLDPATGKQWLLWKTDHMINPRSSKLLTMWLMWKTYHIWWTKFPPLTFNIIILMLLKMIKFLIFFRVSEVVIQELNEDGVSFVEGSSPTVGSLKTNELCLTLNHQAIFSDDHEHLPEEHRIVEGMWMMFRQNSSPHFIGPMSSSNNL